MADYDNWEIPIENEFFKMTHPSALAITNCSGFPLVCQNKK